MSKNKSLNLTDKEIADSFSDPINALRFPPVLSLEQAAELIDCPLGTLRDWRSRGLLSSCSRKIGKHVRVYRDRFLKQIFNEGINSEK